ncbi:MULTISPECIES: ABC transporter ATP-binding protein [unclassified Pseudoalteromonas]|jgi:ABC-type multidrug transport system ATPase subunit|uniref:ABC transporter ATP-binding protein n=1 Tax=unclassified Pseudoalteromonas TaxID=194690 RepID=UPI001602AC07|nr:MULTISPECIES: ABC transporter ATP-binding protein [unclassified Pseudoalteromonas]MBB1294122.1 ABC transporter ATP-binding protein [Pseudoalteromonas sp. SR41-4]MBB1303268.1 ABC transporter ATP-binding protein [Pseudoalteromonas sp. SR44-8]MBB1399619.1 ABC transporter ATP-binding protein [Pseudoalteromonas sp. SG44-8]|tara:strand:+ start:15097 stop:15978 length:882 start_codon:yes stop_codon:yes gene_type:complete
MLSITGLSKTYDNGVHALQGVDLSIGKGLFGLLGPNGAGKSSLMRTVATLQSADAGSVIFDGIDAFKDPQALRQRLGYLPQDFGVYPRVSAYDLLDHMAVLKGLDNKALRKESVEGLLAHTNLYQHRNKAVSGFSGGMRQRFGIAQALLGDPDLLIVDEPTAGLDPEERNRFHNLLVSLGEKKVVILSTHIVEDVAELCPNMAVLASGKILLEGNPIALTDKLQGKIWQKTTNQTEAQELEQHLPVISKRLFAGQTILNVYGEQAPEGFTASHANLEDVYFSTLHQHRNISAA